jgi:GAF domain-containing protein
MSRSARRAAWAASRADLALLVLSEQTVPGLLDVVVDMAVTAVTGVDAASVSLVVHDSGRLETRNASSVAVRAADEAQYRYSGGPCVEAIRTGTEVAVPLPVPRWAAFSAVAGRLGFCSVWSLPLRLGDKTLGALNLYSTAARAGHPRSRPAARALAGQAAVVLANASTLMSARLANRHLLQALDDRDVVGQAKGILMVRHGVSADRAFDVLRRASQRDGRRLGDVAAEVVGSVTLGRVG